MGSDSHYLKKELYELIRRDASIFDFLQNGSFDGIWYWDLENTANEWMSPRFWTTLGYDPTKKQHLVSEWQDLIHPEDLEVALENFKKHCEDSRHPYDQVVRYRHKDGSTVWVRCRGTVIRDDTGKPVRLLGTHTDLTQQKQAEDELKKGERFLRIAFDFIHDGIAMLDNELNVVRANKTMKQWYSHRGALEGKKCYQAYHGRSEPCEICPVLRAIATGKLEKDEVSLREEHRVPRVVEFFAVPMMDDCGNSLGVVEYLHDITERKHQEEVKAAQLRLIKYTPNHTSKELLREFLDEAERLTESELGFFHFVEDDQKTLSLQAWSTNTLKKMCAVEPPKTHYPISLAGVWVECVYRKEPVIHNDYADLKNKKGLPEGHAPVLRELVVPVYREDKIMAILGVGNKKTPYVQRDVQTVQILADMAWETIIRRRAEDELAESQKRYRSLFDDALDMVHIIDDQGVLIDANHSELKTLGYTQAEYFGKPILNYIHPEYREQTKTALTRALAGRSIRGYETVMFTKEGRGVPVEVSAVPLFEQGRVTSVRAIARDMTERKRIEAALRKSEERYREIVENTENLVSEVDVEGRFIFVNEASRNVFGLAPCECIGRSAFEFIHPDDRKRTIDSFARWVAAKQDNVTFENRQMSVDGQVRDMLWNINLSFDENHNIKSIKSIARDITERKKAEKELTRYREHLEELVNERTAELKRSNERLQIEILERKKAEKELRKYAETQSVLVREVNHRVKNNLAAIISMLHMEMDRTRADGLSSNSTVLEDLVGRIEGLATVHSLLSASGWRPLKISELCRQVVNATLQGVPLGKEIRAEIPPCSTQIDSSQAHHLTLVFHELTTNTVKYALKNRSIANIFVDIHQRGRKVELVFRDDGPGYPDYIIDGNPMLPSIGFELIQGIVRRSLNGEVAFDNENGAVARISFKNILTARMKEVANE